MIIESKILSKNHRLYVGGNYKKTSITIHSTGNQKSNAHNERDWLDNKSNHRNASWHYCVDDSYIVQANDDYSETWHCGNQTGNMFSLSIEICESGDRLKTLLNTINLVTDKLIEHNISISQIKKHFDWSGKSCPRILIDKKYIKNGLDWNWFITQCENEFRGKSLAMTQEQFNLYMDNYLNGLCSRSQSEWAKDTQEQAITIGITDGTNPQMFATREQVIAMIIRALNIK